MATTVTCDMQPCLRVPAKVCVRVTTKDKQEVKTVDTRDSCEEHIGQFVDLLWQRHSGTTDNFYTIEVRSTAV